MAMTDNLADLGLSNVDCTRFKTAQRRVISEGHILYRTPKFSQNQRVPTTLTTFARTPSSAMTVAQIMFRMAAISRDIVKNNGRTDGCNTAAKRIGCHTFEPLA